MNGQFKHLTSPDIRILDQCVIYIKLAIMNINFKELIKVYGSDIGKQRVKQDNAPHKPFCLYLHFLPF